MKKSLTEKISKDERSKSVPAIPDNIIETNPNYLAELNEYRDGILLFNLTDKNVWSKAVKDAEGLKAYYEKNKYSYGDFQTSKAKITADYQAYLEKEWLGGLRKKYPVILNRTVYNQLLSELR
ncbi:MAG: hypothetical protein IAF38_02865 [Bacteroidia bacterium]|nr:hypothetical protein [Bacteroidia bacterium]